MSSINANSLSLSLAKSILKKAKRERLVRGNVTFDMVTVFLFPRCQGFSSVPSRGGCSLGMVQRHSALRRYTLEEYAVEQRVLRREKLINRLREEKLDALKQKVKEADRLTVDDIPEDEMDVSSYNLDDGSFLHPYPSKRRHALLKAAGVKMVQEEKRQLQQLRVSREDCGCDCQGFCEPETCACSLAGIKCQMDHSSFPCGCTKDGCGNQEGRIEFNSSRVQTHYIHTIMKLELEKRLEETSGPEEEDPGETTPAPGHAYNPLSDLPSIPDGPSFYFSSELEAVGENSCGSDMTDSSASSGGSEDSEEGAGLGREDDENGLSRVLGFSDNDYNVNYVVNDNRCCPEQRLQQQQQALSTTTTTWMLTGFRTADFPEENLEVHGDDRAMSQLVDDTANQGNRLFHHSGCRIPNPPSPSVDRPNAPSPSVDRPNAPSPSVDRHNVPSPSVDCPNAPSPSVDCPNAPSPSVDCPNAPSPSVDGTAASYMDLSLSSESDLEFFDGFCLGPSSLYNSLTEYQHMDNFFHFQVPSYPSSQSQTSDPGTCLLESLIGLSESVPEPPATFTDNQLLEEAVRG
uniref:Cysteine-serine-rich nuclear protein 1b n=1 Tax=Hucho hucho TaxID=62062 RepID=A0A4W5L2M6_9TELE